MKGTKSKEGNFKAPARHKLFVVGGSSPLGPTKENTDKVSWLLLYKEVT